MELHQLRYLVSVAEEASFTGAATKLHVAQPGVSAQIRLLERELGQELFDRAGRRVRLTEAGRAVMPYARAALAAVAAVRQAADEVAGLLRGHVTFGTITSHNADLPGLLSGFHRDHPGITITLTEGNSADLVDALRGGLLDCAIISVGPSAPDGLGLKVIDDQPLAAAVSRDDPLATRRTMPLDLLRDRELICLPQGTGIRAILDAACRERGFTPKVAFEASTPETLLTLAEKGLGVAIVPAPYLRNASRVAALSLRPALRGSLALAWRIEGPASPAAMALLTRARAAFRST